MAVDLNLPPEEDEAGEPGVQEVAAGQDMVHEAVAGHSRHVGHEDGASFMDLSVESYDSDGNVVVDGLNANAEVANFDLNDNLYESDSDGEDLVYAEDFHVVLGAGNQHGTSNVGHAHAQQGSQAQNTNVVRRRKSQTEEVRRHIYEELLYRSRLGILQRTAATIVAGLFNVNRCYVQSIWREAKKCRAAGVPLNLSSKRKGACGRPPIQVDLSIVLTIPLSDRTTLKALADRLHVSKTALHRLFKEGLLHRHSNTLKPCLRDDNKIERLKYCMAMLDATTVQNDPKFYDMRNIIHIDEKWFNTTRKIKKFYMLPEEEDPLRSIQNTHSIPKCMLLCAVCPPRYDSEGNCCFDGKIGIWPFVRKEPAQRDSVNRPRGTLITKPINVTKEVSRSYLITKVLPAIVARWPQQHRGETIWIQQDNARTHVDPNDGAFLQAISQTGLDIRIYNQPPNLPDLNVLDLGFFASLQSKTFLTTSRNMDELIQNVQNEFNNYDPYLIRKVFLTHQSCMIEIMQRDGGNNYRVPHMKKDALEAAGMLPTRLNVTQDLYQSVLHKLAV